MAKRKSEDRRAAWRAIAGRHGVNLNEHPLYDPFGDSAKLFGGEVPRNLQAALDEYRSAWDIKCGVD